MNNVQPGIDKRNAKRHDTLNNANGEADYQKVEKHESNPNPLSTQRRDVCVGYGTAQV